MPGIEAAYRGRVEMLGAIFGGAEKPPRGVPAKNGAAVAAMLRGLGARQS